MARNNLSNSDSMDELLEHPAPFYERVKAMIKTKIHSGAWPASARLKNQRPPLPLLAPCSRASRIEQ